MELGVDDSGVVLENDSDGMVGGGEKMRNAECGIVMNVQCAMCNVQLNDNALVETCHDTSLLKNVIL